MIGLCLGLGVRVGKHLYRCRHSLLLNLDENWIYKKVYTLFDRYRFYPIVSLDNRIIRKAWWRKRFSHRMAGLAVSTTGLHVTIRTRRVTFLHLFFLVTISPQVRRESHWYTGGYREWRSENRLGKGIRGKDKNGTGFKKMVIDVVFKFLNIVLSRKQRKGREFHSVEVRQKKMLE